jgi:cytochrome c peroxidase
MVAQIRKDRTIMLKRFLLLAFAIGVFFVLADRLLQPVWSQSISQAETRAVAQLGERLFTDERFTTPKGDLVASCSTCHVFDENPQGIRAYTDFFIKSWMASREKDPRRLMLRNSPTLLDTREMTRLHYDGEFASLEELVKGTLTGRPMGWLPGEEAEAVQYARVVLLADKGEGAADKRAYREQFQKSFGVDLVSLTADQTIELIARAVATYCRSLNSLRDSAYDRFMATNRLENRPRAGESGAAYGDRLLAEIRALEARKALQLTSGFKATALSGLKVFFNAERGNCLGCHLPPQFTDYSFHNIGVSQREFDQLHGAGKFAALTIPDAASARRPAAQFREAPSKSRPGEADLGYWNFANLKTSALRRAGDSDESFLRRMIATFKTPTLRNLQYTQPYFHNGSLHTLEEVMSEMIVLSEMARANQVREADEELAKVKLTSADIAPLVAFLDSLNDDLKRAPYRRR